MIETPHLRLIPADVSHFETVLLGNELLSAVLGVKVPDKWTEFPEAILISYDKVKTDPSLLGWFFHFIIHKNDNALIGTAGYKGRPNKRGMVEIGYEIIPAYRQKGYATEVAMALVKHAFSFPEVKKVIAHTLTEFNASTTVLQKTGMQFTGVKKDKEEGTIWRWEIFKKDYLPKK